MGTNWDSSCRAVKNILPPAKAVVRKLATIDMECKHDGEKLWGMKNKLHCCWNSSIYLIRIHVLLLLSSFHPSTPFLMSAKGDKLGKGRPWMAAAERKRKRKQSGSVGPAPNHHHHLLLPPLRLYRSRNTSPSLSASTSRVWFGSHWSVLRSINSSEAGSWLTLAASRDLCPPSPLNIPQLLESSAA